MIETPERFQTWLSKHGERQLAGSVNIQLALDAKRLGQDLVGELVENALRDAERHFIAS